MRKIFRLLLLSGSLILLIVTGLLASVYLVRVRLAQYAMDHILEDADLVEARASVDLITPKSMVISDVVLAGAGWRFEVDELRSTHDAWSLRIHEIETGEGRLFVDVDQILKTPSKRSKDELADLIAAIQTALPEMGFSVNRIRAELVFMGRRIELTVSGEGNVSSVHQLAVSLQADCGALSAEVALQSSHSGQVVGITGRGRVTKLADWMGQVAASWRDLLPVDGPFDLDASSVTGGFRLELSRLRPVGLQADVGVTGLDGCFRDHLFFGDFLDLTAQWAPGEGAEFDAVSGGMHLDDGQLEIDIPLARFGGRVGESIIVSSEQVIVEDGQLSGSIEFEATIPWPDTMQLPVGTVVDGSVADLITFDYGWNPIDFDLEIEPDLARIRVRRLEILEEDWPILSNFEATLPLIEGSLERFSWQAAIDLATDPAGPVSAEPGFPLSVSGDVSGLGAGVVRGSVRVEPSGDRAVLHVDGIGSFNTTGGFDLSVEMSGNDRIAAEIGLKFERIEIAMDRVDADIASFALDLSVPPTPIARWSQLSGLNLFERVEFAAGLDLKMELVGDRLSLPGEVVLEWFDFNLIQGPARKTELGGHDLQVTLSAANLRAGGESLHSIEIIRDMTFAEREIRSGGHLKALFDGSLLTGQFDDRIHFGENGLPAEIRGRVQFEPLEIRHSDLIARHFSEAAGLSMGAILSLSADGWWSVTQPWDVSLDFSVNDGSLTFPPKNFHMEGIEGGLQIASLRDRRAAPGATWSFRRLTVSDLAMDHGRMVFGFDGTDRLGVVALSFEAFNGKFHLDPFSYSIAERTADLRLHVTGLDVGVLLEQLDFYKGSFEGSIDGFVPFAIRKGSFVPKQGRLELTPGVPVFFHYPAEGLLTRGEVAKTMTDRLRLLPLQVAEKGLGNVRVETLTVDLFDPAYPSSPARIYLAGKALADETEVPYFISTNINGTVAEVLNFLFRLSSL